VAVTLHTFIKSSLYFVNNVYGVNVTSAAQPAVTLHASTFLSIAAEYQPRPWGTNEATKWLAQRNTSTFSVLGHWLGIRINGNCFTAAVGSFGTRLAPDALLLRTYTPQKTTEQLSSHWGSSWFLSKLSLRLTKHHAMKTYRGSGGIAPRILCPRDWMEVSGQLHAPAALPLGKEPWYTLDMGLGRPQSRYGHGNEEKNSQPPPGLEPPITPPVVSRYTDWDMPTSLTNR
jgi:hypothetical protein